MSDKKIPPTKEEMIVGVLLSQMPPRTQTKVLMSALCALTHMSTRPEDNEKFIREFCESSISFFNDTKDGVEKMMKEQGGPDLAKMETKGSC